MSTDNAASISRSVRSRLRPSATPRIARSSSRTSHNDPWSGLEAVVAAPTWAAWADGERGLCFLAVEALVTLAPTGSARFAAARASCSALAERLVHPLGDHFPFMVGGFGFAPGAGAVAFPDARLFVPKVLWAGRSGGAVWRVEHRLEGAAELFEEPAMAPPRPSRLAQRLGLRSLPDADGYRALVQRAREAIEAGAIEKVVLARRAVGELSKGRFDVAATLRELRARHPGATVFGFGFEGQAFVGASPELLAALDGRTLRTQALAGTGGEDLLESEKDRREHAHVVDDIARALAPIAEKIRVAPAPELRRAGGFFHLSTAVEAETDAHLFDAIEALHPTAALSGAPRGEAADYLRRAEQADRGWYGAPVGWVAPDGGGVFAVAIRSALLRGARAEAWAGAGIVAGSDPEREWLETEAKLTTLTGALRVEDA